MKNRSSSGFSITELLVVVAIMGILAALAVPATSSILESTNVTRGAQIIENQIELARQLASSKSRTVEVRFIKTGDLPGGGLDAVQLWQIEPPQGANAATNRPVSRLERLPTAVCIAENASKLSRLLATCGLTNSMPSASPLSGKSYAALKIQPSGLVAPDMAMNIAYLTVVPAREAQASEPPKNFATIQINPVTGTPQTYRP